MYRMAHFKGSDIKKYNTFHSFGIKSCRTENNVCLVGGLQELHDQSSWTAAITKDSDTKNLEQLIMSPPL